MFRKFKWLILYALYRIICLFSNQRQILILKNSISDSYGNIPELIKIIQRFPEKRRLKVVFEGENPLRIVWFIAKAKVIVIDQSNKYISNIKILDKTKTIHCWHGGGILKKIAYDDIKNISEIEKKRLARIYRNIDYFIISDKNLSSVFAKAYNININKILPIGLPRTDKLYHLNVEACRKQLIEDLHLALDARFILYAPTFREINGKRVTPIPPVIPNRLRKKWIFLFRSHPSIKIKRLPEPWIDVSETDAYAILPCVDILISDFSSIIYDFSYFKRPILILATDLYEYIDKQRGIYLKLDSITDKSQIFTCWERAFDYVNKDCFLQSCLWQKYMNACDGEASYKLFNLIKKIVHDENKNG